MKTFGEISMKKSLIALAVLSAVAGAAQAQSSNVTIYGLVDMGIQRQDIGGTATTALDSGNQSGSRLGFKGTEDLGGGLKANFKLEMGVNADTGKSAQNGVTFGRQAYVGLSGNLGAVNFGRQYTPVFVAIDSFDPFSTGMSSGTAGSGTSTLGAGAYFDHGGVRQNNSVTYATNDLSGFALSAIYGFGKETPGDNKDGTHASAVATYTAGPLFVEAGYSDTAGGLNSSLFAGTYDFSVVKLHAAYQYQKTDAAPAVIVKRDVYSFGVTVPVSAAGNIVANYINSKNKNTFVTDADASQVAVGYTHSLSKRTNLYTSYSQANNDANINLGSADSSPTFHPVPNGATVKLFNVGIRHMF
jgi:predicted porin